MVERFRKIARALRYATILLKYVGKVADLISEVADDLERIRPVAGGSPGVLPVIPAAHQAEPEVKKTVSTSGK